MEKNSSIFVYLYMQEASSSPAHLFAVQEDKINCPINIMWEGILQGIWARNFRDEETVPFENHYWKVFMSVQLYYG